MSERTRNGKTFAQDALGFLFILVGGIFAVSIVLSMRGQAPRPGPISILTWPVVELVTLLGPAAGLLFSAGLAVLGTLLFLRSTQLAALRPLLAILFGSLGVASIFGGFGAESVLGAWLPGLVPGIVGRGLALVLGLALAWLGWTLLSSARPPRSSSAEVVQRVSLAARHDAASGVSPAEAALLVSEPRTLATQPVPRREPLPRRDAAPVRDETLRPFPPPREVAVSEKRAARSEGPSGPQRGAVEPLSVQSATPPILERSSSASEPPVSVLTPPPPSWEGEPEAEQQPGNSTAQGLSAALSAEFETEGAGVIEADEELGGEEEDEEEGAGAPPSTPRASWEQIGLFDEEEELEEEVPPTKPARVELTSTFDFESSEPRKPAHEPDATEHDPFAVAPAPASAASTAPEPEAGDDEDEDYEEEEEDTDEQSELVTPMPPAPARRQASLPTPTPAPRSEPVVARDEAEERWEKLVFEAGCAILEQKRVAVSMLERRFAIDFDQACRVLDELQQAGLIGPYMGGRTRDILLTREQWLPHAPQAS